MRIVTAIITMIIARVRMYAVESCTKGSIFYTIIKTISVCDGNSVGDWLALHGKQT